MKKRVLASEDKRKNVSSERNEHYVSILKEMVNCKTVFKRNFENQADYDKFYTVIEKSFPNLTSKAKRLTFGSGCFVYVIEGKEAKKNVMLMSHHDVVDGEDTWGTNPFEATIKEDSLYGRGTIDTKTPLFAELQACEELLSEGYDFEGINLYIGSSNNEEVGGDGMVLATEYFKENGIRFDTVLDEGGAILQGMLPGVKDKSAFVAVHEKGRHIYKCTAKQISKGHGGLNPNNDNAIARMCEFISEVNKTKIFKNKFYPEVKATFTHNAPYMSFPLNIVFGNFDLFSPLIMKIMSNIPQTSAMLSTGVIFTTVFGGTHEDPQIKAKEVEATMFLRCLREEELYEGIEKIKSIGTKYGVELEEILRDYCVPTDYTNRPYKVLEEVLNEDFPDIIVSPFLLTAGTDARHFSDIADNILRFAPIDLDKAQYASIHGDNEHIKIKNIGECVCFYKDFVKKI